MLISSRVTENYNHMNPQHPSPMKRISVRLPFWFLAAALVAGLAGSSFAQTNDSKAESTNAVAKPKREPDVIFVPTPNAVVDKMLEMAEIKPGDVVYDLGCGDGRIVVAAAKKYGVKAVGFDINPQRVQESLENVKTNHVEKLVTIKEADIFTLDLSEANVVTLYLLPDLNVKLMPQLAKLKPGSRIVSHDFDMRGAKPVDVQTVTVKDDVSQGSEHTVYKWVVPWTPE
jgi:SAM-dependent methyltransferase